MPYQIVFTKATWYVMKICRPKMEQIRIDWPFQINFSFTLQKYVCIGKNKTMHFVESYIEVMSLGCVVCMFKWLLGFTEITDAFCQFCNRY